MPLDAIFLSAAAEELRNKITGTRVDKLRQPEKDVLILDCRGREEGFRLLISAGHGSARVHITEKPRENPDTPPMFCMLLRKHLLGARITGLTSPPLERLYTLQFACYDDMGEPCEKTLAVEMMGRNTNIVLIDGEGRIIDCLYRVDPEQEEKRALLPGRFYRLPSPTGKKSPYELDPDQFDRLYFDGSPGQDAASRLVDSFSGVSPMLAREALFAAYGTADIKAGETESVRLYGELRRLLEAEKQPVMLLEEDKPFDVWCLPVRQYGAAVKVRVYDCFSSLLDDYYTERERAERLAQRCRNIVREVKTRRDRVAKKLALRSAELENAADREQLRRQGDIIKANIYRMERGMSVLKAADFYSENGVETEIPLDVRLSPQQNAAKYYKAYSKAKNAEKLLGEQIAQARGELDYLESVLEELERVESE
ncbi:MAG: NFACT family protein, partial [Oscillospiraceae bacterium]|nr:NFACT family protein [Oscillospiraceae bacterium]